MEFGRYFYALGSRGKQRLTLVFYHWPCVPLLMSWLVPESPGAEGEAAGVWETHRGDDRHLGAETTQNGGDRSGELLRIYILDSALNRKVHPTFIFMDLYRVDLYRVELQRSTEKKTSNKCCKMIKCMDIHIQYICRHLQVILFIHINTVITRHGERTTTISRNRTQLRGGVCRGLVSGGLVSGGLVSGGVVSRGGVSRGGVSSVPSGLCILNGVGYFTGGS